MRQWIEKLESEIKQLKYDKDVLAQRLDRFEEDVKKATSMGLINTKLGAEKIFSDFFNDVNKLKSKNEK